MPSTPAHGPIALVVDDDPAMQHLIDEVLTDAGLLVYTAGDGRAALNVIEECQPDVIVLDLEMPVMTGREFYRRLRQSGRSTPVIILSSLGSDAARRELGAQDSLTKPFDIDALADHVLRLAGETSTLPDQEHVG